MEYLGKGCWLFLRSLSSCSEKVVIYTEKKILIPRKTFLIRIRQDEMKVFKKCLIIGYSYINFCESTYEPALQSLLLDVLPIWIYQYEVCSDESKR
jgi:hypothetical protein